MKAILALIEQRQQAFAQLPIFQLMRDPNIAPEQKLIWAPCLAPLALGFADLNCYVFRQEPTTDPLQQLINEHTYEDDYHWEWFLKDLETLGLNPQGHLTDSLRFLWSDDTKNIRMVCPIIAQQVFQAEPAVVLLAIQAVESTFGVMLPLAVATTQELRKATQQDYYYFGNIHLDIENSHAKEECAVKAMLEEIVLTPAQTKKAEEVVHNIFDAFSACVQDMFNYTQKQLAKQRSLAPA